MEVKLIMVGGKQAGKEIPVSSSPFVIGRGQECQLRVQSDVISRKHCAIVVDQEVVAVEDSSTNGTFVNGERIQKRRELSNGDQVKIASLEFEVRWTVDVQGKKKPRVRSIQEAAARVTASAAGGDELDISGWLETDEDQKSAVWPVKEPATNADTAAGKSLAETTVVPHPPAKKETKTTEQTPAKPGGRFQVAPKQAAEDSGAAANEMLKQFFSRKK